MYMLYERVCVHTLRSWLVDTHTAVVLALTPNQWQSTAEINCEHKCAKKVSKHTQRTFIMNFFYVAFAVFVVMLLFFFFLLSFQHVRPLACYQHTESCGCSNANQGHCICIRSIRSETERFVVLYDVRVYLLFCRGPLLWPDCSRRCLKGDGGSENVMHNTGGKKNKNINI